MVSIFSENCYFLLWLQLHRQRAAFKTHLAWVVGRSAAIWKRTHTMVNAVLKLLSNKSDQSTGRQEIFWPITLQVSTPLLKRLPRALQGFRECVYPTSLVLQQPGWTHAVAPATHWRTLIHLIGVSSSHVCIEQGGLIYALRHRDCIHTCMHIFSMHALLVFFPSLSRSLSLSFHAWFPFLYANVTGGCACSSEIFFDFSLTRWPAQRGCGSRASAGD